LQTATIALPTSTNQRPKINSTGGTPFSNPLPQNGPALGDMAVNNGVRARNGIANTTEVKEEMVDVKMEDDALSTTAELNSGIATKSKPSRMLFSHLPSVKKEALSTFQEITESIYQFSDLGESQQQDVMACECKPNISGISLL